MQMLVFTILHFSPLFKAFLSLARCPPAAGGQTTFRHFTIGYFVCIQLSAKCRIAFIYMENISGSQFSVSLFRNAGVPSYRHISLAV